MIADYWTDLQTNIHKRLLNEDVKDFLDWSAIITTMFVGEAPYIAIERAALIEAGWDDATTLPEWGNQPSTNLLHQAYHLFQWEKTTGKQVKELGSILEIGAGYGAMARVARARGFAGRYTIIDLPEMMKIQRFYLAQYGGEVEWRRSTEGVEADLLISLWGLSEISLHDRARLIDGIKSKTGHVLLGYQDTWGPEINNENYFLETLGGKLIDIPHLPSHQYQIG
jgi:hypothetical protein